MHCIAQCNLLSLIVLLLLLLLYGQVGDFCRSRCFSNSVLCVCVCVWDCVCVRVRVQLLNHHVVTELLLMDVLMNNMMERISDPCCTVRMLAVRGLGNIATGSPEKVLAP